MRECNTLITLVFMFMSLLLCAGSPEARIIHAAALSKPTVLRYDRSGLSSRAATHPVCIPRPQHGIIRLVVEIGLWLKLAIAVAARSARSASMPTCRSHSPPKSRMSVMPKTFLLPPCEQPTGNQCTDTEAVRHSHHSWARVGL
jgi:hypothetical protein